MKTSIVFLMVLMPCIYAQEIKKITDGQNFPEGPAWDGKRYLYVSNCYADWITRISDTTWSDTFVIKPTKPVSFGKTNGLTVYKDGDIYACDYGLGAIIRFNHLGACSIVVAGYNGAPFNRPNDLAFDKSGNLYFTDPNSYDQNNRDGRLFVYLRDKNKTLLIAENLAFPNGLAFSPDAKYLYVCESALNRVIKFEVQDNGELGNYEVFIILPGGDPDGIAFDREGNLYVAHFGRGTVYVVSDRGKIINEIKTPGKKPTNLEFGDSDMQTLFITEAETNSVYRKRVKIPGIKLFSSP